jgi:hypothetical protein
MNVPASFDVLIRNLLLGTQRQMRIISVNLAGLPIHIRKQDLSVNTFNYYYYYYYYYYFAIVMLSVRNFHSLSSRLVYLFVFSAIMYSCNLSLTLLVCCVCPSCSYVYLHCAVSAIGLVAVGSAHK